MELTEKLYGFPKIYSISLQKDVKRRNRLLKTLLDYNITNVHFNITKTFQESNEWWEGENNYYASQLCDIGKSIVINHLKNINQWLTTTSNDEQYAFFCEDDVSFETVKYWNFSWLEFINVLPKNWECIQLHCLRTHYIFPLKNEDMKLHIRNWYDWSATCYILKRSYAQKLTNLHITPQGIYRIISQIQTPFFDPVNEISEDIHKAPYPEHIIYGSSNNVYTVPLLIENYEELGTTVIEESQITDEMREDAAKREAIGIGHMASYKFLKKWWEENTHHTLKDIVPDIL